MTTPAPRFDSPGWATVEDKLRAVYGGQEDLPGLHDMTHPGCVRCGRRTLSSARHGLCRDCRIGTEMIAADLGRWDPPSGVVGRPLPPLTPSSSAAQLRRCSAPSTST